MIRTIEWLRDEARGISSSWNGKDEFFMHEGELRPANDADIALELVDKLREVEGLAKELGI